MPATSLTRLPTRYSRLLVAARTALTTSFSERTNDAEELDDLNASGEDLRRSLRELAWLNRWLGGRGTMLSGVKVALTAASLPAVPHLVDVGCGSGDGLRQLADWARAAQRTLRLTGLDANPNTLHLARELSVEYPEIEYVQANALTAGWAALCPNIITANLFCHHLSDTDLKRWLLIAVESNASAIVINDLQRSWLAHTLFLSLCAVLNLSHITRHDGAVSVRRGFTRTELTQLARLHPLRHTLRSCFAFRYQLVALR